LRIPDYDGLMFWVNAYDDGASLGAISGSFAGSEEFRQRYGSLSKEAFVTMMYVGMLRRSPEQEGFNYSVNYLDSGGSGLALIHGFLNSTEYASRFQ